MSDSAICLHYSHARSHTSFDLVSQTNSEGSRLSLVERSSDSFRLKDEDVAPFFVSLSNDVPKSEVEEKRGVILHHLLRLFSSLVEGRLL